MREPKTANIEGGRLVKFTVDFDQKPEKTIAVHAFVFGSGGKLLASAAVKEGAVELPLEAVKRRGMRLIFAPLEEEKEGLSLPQLERMPVYEPVWEFDPKKLSYKLLPFPHEIWKWWLKCKCRVRGKVVKPVVIDGVLVDKPVCDARVHICEVDKLWLIIPHLPPHLIFKLRDDLIAELKKPPHIPEPDPEIFRWPPPLPDPPEIFKGDLPRVISSFDPQPEPPGKIDLGSRMSDFNPQPEPPGGIDFARKMSDFAPQPEPPRIIGEGLNWLNPQPEPPSPLDRFNQVALNPQPLPPHDWFTLRTKQAMALQQPVMDTRALATTLDLDATLKNLPADTLTALFSNSPVAVSDVLVANYKLLLPYLCYWPWLHPYLCKCDELTTVITDHHGQFDVTITYPCFGDHPDLYFWVDYPIGGVWTPVYKPTYMCCHTYWNYVCGSEVTIHVTDPRVHWCEENPDLDGLNVVITTIGNAISMSEIQGGSGATKGFTTDGEPFAGTLELRMDLSRTNLINLGVTHYRWSYRRVTYGDGVTTAVDGWHPMATPVYRFYKVMVPNPTPPPALKPYYPSDKMGPDLAFPGQNLFRIQPADPPAPGIEWSFINEHYDMAYAYFETAALRESDGVTPAAGQYELKLELFDSAGNLVKWNNPTGTSPATPIYAFKSSNAAPFQPPVGMTTVLAPADNLILDGSGNTWGYRMTLYVDNNPCHAAIYDAWADTSSKAAGPCGFINFNDINTSQAHLSFWAHQAYNHAMFLFRVDKGSSGDIAAATAGWNYIWNTAVYAPVGAASVNGYARDAFSQFSKDLFVTTLLNANGFNCTQAAFAETLYVYATAVDGYTRAYWLDASGVPHAFALAPGS